MIRRLLSVAGALIPLSLFPGTPSVDQTALGPCDGRAAVPSSSQQARRWIEGRWVREGGVGDGTESPLLNPAMIAAHGDRFAVYDFGDSQVKVFESDGRLVWRAGGPGQGPNEFANPTDMQFGLDGTIWVLDPPNGRVSIIDRNGRFARLARVALRKSGRAATPAAAIGVERGLPWFALRVGTYYRWSEPNETNQLRPSPQTTIAYGLHGYDEPFGIEVPPSPSFFFRHDRRATAVGGTLTGVVLGTSAVVTFEKGSRADDQIFNPFSESSDRERWRATGSEVRFQLARAIPWGVRAMVVGSVEELSGDGVRPDLTGIAYTGSDRRRAIEADLRRDFGETWSVAVATGAITTGHVRRDFAADLSSDANAATTFFSAEVARRAERASVAAGASVANRIPYGTSYLPPAADLGPNYQRFIAPDLAYEVAQARAFSGWVSATARVGGTTLITMLRFHGASPIAVDEARLQPDGDRNGWSVMVGVRP